MAEQYTPLERQQAWLSLQRAVVALRGVRARGKAMWVRVLVAAISLSALAAPVAAQETGSRPDAQAPAATSPDDETDDVNCESIRRTFPAVPSSDQLNYYHLCQDANRLREENIQLRRQNETLATPVAFLLPWSGLLAAVVGLVVAVLAPIVSARINRRIDEREKRRLEQQRQLKREAHNLELMRGLGAKKLSVRLTSASALLRRFEDIHECLKEAEISGPERASLETEARMIKDAIFAALCQTRGSLDFCKYTADRMVSSFGYLLERDAQGALPERPRDTNVKSPMAEYSLQRGQLSKVYWRGVNASGVDFYECDLSAAGLRDSWFIRAGFYDANLRDAVLRNADMREATFSGADLRGADLSAADLSGAKGLDTAKFDASTITTDTIWPDERRPGVDYPYYVEPEDAPAAATD